MKILFVNKFLYLRGGAETVLFQQKRLLEQAGHTVLLFGMQDPKNEPSPTDRFYPAAVDFQKKQPWMRTLKNAGRAIWSKKVAAQLQALIDAEHPDVAHVHNFTWQLSASIFSVFKKNNIPVVQTLHDFAVISPNHLLFSKGKNCPVPTDVHWYELLYHPCPLETTRKTLIAKLAFYMPRWLGVYPHNVDAFISPSHFMKHHVSAAGITQPISVVRNSLEVETIVPEFTPGSYAVCVARLSPEKGVMNLIRAVRKVPKITLRIVGDGPLAEPIREYIKAKQVRNVTLLGYQTRDQVYETIKQSRMVIIPSESYDNAPVVAVEAMALGKPVVGSAIGGIPEIVADHNAGWLFKPGDVRDIRQTLVTVYDDVAALEQRGRAGRDAVVKEYDASGTVAQLMAVYASVMKKGTQLG